MTKSDSSLPFQNELPEVAWWFAAEPKLPHGDDRPIEIGETHVVPEPLILCRKGLHWSPDPFDALQYAGGVLLYKVKPGGRCLRDHEKGCSTERTYLDMRDATEMLCCFARAEALSVIHLWDAPLLVRQYLETGDDSIRIAAMVEQEVADAPAFCAAAFHAVACAAAWDAVAAQTSHASAALHAADDPASCAAAFHAAACAAVWDADAAHAAWDASRTRFNAAVAMLFGKPK